MEEKMHLWYCSLFIEKKKPVYKQNQVVLVQALLYKGQLYLEVRLLQM